MLKVFPAKLVIANAVKQSKGDYFVADTSRNDKHTVIASKAKRSQVTMEIAAVTSFLRKDEFISGIASVAKQSQPQINGSIYKHLRT